MGYCLIASLSDLPSFYISIDQRLHQAPQKGVLSHVAVCDSRKAEENKTCNVKLLESYLGTTAQRKVGEMKTQHLGGAKKNTHSRTRLLTW